MKSSVICLASQSARRREILCKMKVPFCVVPSFYHERLRHGVPPQELVIAHALGKARRAKLPAYARYVLAADTLVWRGRFYGKPDTLARAFKMLKELSGRSHDVYTGVVLWDRERNVFFQGVARTRVRFKRLSDQSIRNYIREVPTFDKAGAYAIQEGPRIVASFQGSYSNVVGLPRELVRKLFKKCFGRPMMRVKK